MWLILLRAEAKQYGFKKGPWFLNWSHTSGSHVIYYKREEGGVKSVTIPIRLLNLKPDFVAIVKSPKLCLVKFFYVVDSAEGRG